MTTITPTEAFKSKKKFEEFLSYEHPEIISSTLEGYPKANGKVVITISELTQSPETFLTLIGSEAVIDLPKAPFFVWIVANERENINSAITTINKHSNGELGIFVFKAFLNEDKMEFKCLVKPELCKRVAKRTKSNIPQLQIDYWQRYFEICDELQSEIQIEPKQQHWQYISIGKRGVSIMLTVSGQKSYVGVNLVINYDKTIFAKLLECKDQIEKELGKLEWINIPKNKSTRISLAKNVDLTNRENWDDAIKEQIKMAENFKATFIKYL